MANNRVMDKREVMVNSKGVAMSMVAVDDRSTPRKARCPELTSLAAVTNKEDMEVDAVTMMSMRRDVPLRAMDLAVTSKEDMVAAVMMDTRGGID